MSSGTPFSNVKITIEKVYSRKVKSSSADATALADRPDPQNNE